MPSLRIPDDPGAMDERQDEAMAEARRRWRLKLTSLPIAFGVVFGVAWLVDDFGIATVGIPLGVLAWGLPQLLRGPQGQMRSEIAGSVIDVVAKRRPVEDLMKPDLPAAERLAYLRSVSDVLEDPDTVVGRRSRTLGTIAVGVGVSGWGAGGMASVMFGEWSAAAICFAASSAFLLVGAFGFRKDSYRYEVQRVIEKELERLEGGGSMERVARASG